MPITHAHCSTLLRTLTSTLGLKGGASITTPYERATDWIRSQQLFITEQLASVGNRLATWLVVGNAGALVFVVNGFVSGSTCSTSLLRTAAGWFITGLALAFIGYTVGYITTFFANQLVSKLAVLIDRLAVHERFVEQLESDGTELPEDAPLKVTIATTEAEFAALEAKPKRMWIGAVASTALFVLSAAAFVGGVLVPVRASQAELARCNGTSKASQADAKLLHPGSPTVTAAKNKCFFSGAQGSEKSFPSAPPRGPKPSAASQSSRRSDR